MNIIQVIFMGIIQGLTEFLPISSSGHIVLTSNIYKFVTGQDFAAVDSQEIFFDMVIHVGTLLAVLIYFRKDILKLLKAFIEAIKTRDFSSPEVKMCIYIAVGTFLTAVVAFPIHEFAEQLTVYPSIVGLLLVLTGLILLLSERFATNKPKDNNMNIKKSVIIGIAQGIASFPGISRSGTTIATGLMLGLDRVKAARYSFLLSIPIIMLASLFYPLLKIDMSQMVQFDWLEIFVGFIVAFISGYFCIAYFMKFLARYSLKAFAYYCFAVGILMFLAFSFFIK